MNNEKIERSSIGVSPSPDPIISSQEQARALRTTLDHGEGEPFRNTQSLGMDTVKREVLPLMRDKITREIPTELQAHASMIESVILEKFSRYMIGNPKLGKLTTAIETILASENGFAKIQKILEGKTQASDPHIRAVAREADGIVRQIYSMTESSLDQLREGYKAAENNPEQKALFLSLFGHSGKLLAYIDNVAPLEKIATDTNIEKLSSDSLWGRIAPLDKKLQDLQKLEAPFMQSMAKMPPAFLSILKDLLGDTFGDVLAFIFGKASGKELYDEIELGMRVYRSLEKLKSYGIAKAPDGNVLKGKNNGTLPLLQNIDMSHTSIISLKNFYTIMKQSQIDMLSDTFWDDVFLRSQVEVDAGNGKKRVVRFPDWKGLSDKNTPIGLTEENIIAGLNGVKSEIVDMNEKKTPEGEKKSEVSPSSPINSGGNSSGIGKNSTSEKTETLPSDNLGGAFLSATKLPFSYESGGEKLEVDFRDGMFVIGKNRYLVTLGSTLGSWANYKISGIAIPSNDASGIEMKWSKLIPFPDRFAKKDIPISEIANLKAGTQITRTIGNIPVTFDRIQ